MSSAHDAPGGSAHPDPAHDAFDGEPATALPADEPRSPAWLPLLGLALFVGAGVYFLVGGDDPGGAAEKLAPMELQAPPPPQAAQAPQAAPAGQPPDNALRKMTPQQMDELRKKVEAARAKGQAPGQPAHP